MSEHVRRCTRWTDEERLVLREMYDAGASYTEIAERLSRTMVSVRQQCVIAGWCRSGRRRNQRLWTAREVSEALRLRDLGWSYPKIGAELGRSCSSVVGMMRSR